MRSKRLNFSVYQEVERNDSDQNINVEREMPQNMLKKQLSDERTNWRFRLSRRAVDVITCQRRSCSCPSLGFRDTLYYGIIPLLIVVQVIFSAIRGGYDGGSSIIAQWSGISGCLLYIILYMTDHLYDCRLIDPYKADTKNSRKNALVWSLPSLGGIIVRAIILHGIAEDYSSVCPTFTFNNAKCL
jgi:hypothetical protein